jgi:hypothetical protein
MPGIGFSSFSNIRNQIADLFHHLILDGCLSETKVAQMTQRELPKFTVHKRYA